MINKDTEIPMKNICLVAMKTVIVIGVYRVVKFYHDQVQGWFCR